LRIQAIWGQLFFSTAFCALRLCWPRSLKNGLPWAALEFFCEQAGAAIASNEICYLLHASNIRRREHPPSLKWAAAHRVPRPAGLKI
jgi:hypothetical protein